jgi:hypothetical protein
MPCLYIPWGSQAATHSGLKFSLKMCNFDINVDMYYMYAYFYNQISAFTAETHYIYWIGGLLSYALRESDISVNTHSFLNNKFLRIGKWFRMP